MNDSELLDLLKEIQNSLRAYSSVHDRLFGFSLKKLLPFLGRHEPNVSPSDLESLRSVQTRLRICQARLEAPATPIPADLSGTVNEYLGGLTAATEHLYLIVERKIQQATHPLSYPPEQYALDVSLYESARNRFLKAGRDVWQLGKLELLAEQTGSAVAFVEPGQTAPEE